MADVRPFEEMPGPPPRFLVGELPAFKDGKPWEPCLAYGEKYGPLTRIKILGKSVVVLNGADEIADVLERNTDAYYKDAPRAALLPLTNDSSTFTSPGGKHWAERRHANPLSRAEFGPWLAAQMPAMHALIEERLAAFAKQGTPGDLYGCLFRLSFDVFSRVFVGKVLPDEVFECFVALATIGSRRMMWKLPFGRPWGKKAAALQERWMGYFRAIVAEGRRAPAGQSNIVALRLTGDGDDEAIVAELANNYYGGCFSATSGIMGCLYELTRHPEERARARAAARALRDAGGLADFAKLNADAVLDALLREGLRVHPPVAVFQRRVKLEAGTALGGYEMPAGTAMLISCYHLHLDAKHWGSDAKSFRPARWANGVAAANPYGSGHFFPFGRGERACLGEHFAMAYMKLTLATLLAGYEPEFGAGAAFEKEMFFAVIRPKGMVGRLTAKAG